MPPPMAYPEKKPRTAWIGTAAAADRLIADQDATGDGEIAVVIDGTPFAISRAAVGGSADGLVADEKTVCDGERAARKDGTARAEPANAGPEFAVGRGFTDRLVARRSWNH